MSVAIAVAEEWRPIPSLGSRYLASSAGRIMGPHRRALSLKVHTHGYLLFAVADGKGSSRNHSVARAVCEAFNGPPPSGAQVDHIDRIRDHDEPSNLRWVTKAENLAHRQHRRGQQHANAKLTEADVRAIRASGVPSTVLAARYGVGVRHVRGILKGTNWSHVNGR